MPPGGSSHDVDSTNRKRYITTWNNIVLKDEVWFVKDQCADLVQ